MLAAGRHYLGLQEASAGVPEEDLIRVAVQSMGLDQITPFDPRERIVEHTVAEPCHPINVAHGHVHQLMEQNPDWILMPNVINAEASTDQM